jgi:hypothetical protein
MEARLSRSIRYLAAGLVAGPLAMATTGAHAVVTQRLKDACRSEYFTYCAQYQVGSPGLRSCMRAVQDRLSFGCLKEMVAAGEASPSEIREYKKHHQQ